MDGVGLRQRIPLDGYHAHRRETPKNLVEIAFPIGT